MNSPRIPIPIPIASTSLSSCGDSPYRIGSCHALHQDQTLFKLQILHVFSTGVCGICAAHGGAINLWRTSFDSFFMSDRVGQSQFVLQKSKSRTETKQQRTNCDEQGEVNDEVRDLVDLGSEDKDLRVRIGERESHIAWRQLNVVDVVVVEELVLWSEHDSKCESVESLHSRAWAQREYSIVVADVRCRRPLEALSLEPPSWLSPLELW